MTFKTFYQSDETWPIFDNFDNYWQLLKMFAIFLQYFSYIFYDQFEFFWQFWHFWIPFTMTMTMIIQETCGLWDIDYNFDNLEPEFMTIFVTWQLRVTLESIRNSCNVSHSITKNVQMETRVTYAQVELTSKRKVGQGFSQSVFWETGKHLQTKLTPRPGWHKKYHCLENNKIPSLMDVAS